MDTNSAPLMKRVPSNFSSKQMGGSMKSLLRCRWYKEADAWAKWHSKDVHSSKKKVAFAFIIYDDPEEMNYEVRCTMCVKEEDDSV